VSAWSQLRSLALSKPAGNSRTDERLPDSFRVAAVGGEQEPGGDQLRNPGGREVERHPDKASGPTCPAAGIHSAAVAGCASPPRTALSVTRNHAAAASLTRFVARQLGEAARSVGLRLKARSRKWNAHDHPPHHG
jgi:hypothetical protein